MTAALSNSFGFGGQNIALLFTHDQTKTNFDVR
ncbi:3-oxoacyl-(acyl-carrier-protein) synthase [Actinoplanes couchii]|nr:3-oxoacyl-(acyl-carrier-protein) synthase [Actinoplanes couchii]